MRKYTASAVAVLVFLLIFAGIFYDGDKFEFGVAFRNTDSTTLKATVTTLMAADSTNDTLYTKALEMNPDEIDGHWTIKAYFAPGDATTMDSIDLAVRFGTRFDNDTYKWGPWKNIFVGMKDDTLYAKYIAQKDSSWFLNSSGRQFRVICRDALAEGDTLATPYVTDYLH